MNKNAIKTKKTTTNEFLKILCCKLKRETEREREKNYNFKFHKIIIKTLQ